MFPPSLALGLIALAAAAAPTATPPPSAKVVRHSRPLYGTVVEIVATVATDEQAKANAPFEAAFDEVRRVETLVDEDDPHSPVSRINAAAGHDAVVVDP